MGISFSHEDESTDQTRNQPDQLLSWAAEIVVRQREEEQEARAERIYRNNNNNQAESRLSSQSSSNLSQNSVRNFASISDLLRELLNQGRIRLVTMSRTNEVREIAIDSENDNESDDGEYSTGIRGRNIFESQTSSISNQFNNNSSHDREYSRSSNGNNSANGTSSARTSGVCTAAQQKNIDKHLIQSRNHLLNEIELHSGAYSEPVSIERLVSNREIGLRYAGKCQPKKGCRSHLYSRHPTRSALYPFQCASTLNSFFPNRKKVVEKIRTKTFCCQYLPDGNGLLTASQDEMIRLYERKGYRQRYKLTKHFEAPYVGWSILDLVISPDSRHFVYCTWSERLYQCKLGGDSGEDERWSTLIQNPGDTYGRFAFFSLRFNFDGSEIVSAGSDGRLYVYDRESASNVLSIPAHEDDVNAVSFGDTSRHLIFSAGDDGLCKVWDRRALGDDHRPVGVFAGHRDGITYVDSRGDDRYLLTNSKDQSIKIWDIRRFSSVSAQDETRRAVCQQKWDYRYQTMPRHANCSSPLKGDGSVMTLRGHSVLHTLIRAHFSPMHTGQRYVYTGCARGQCVVYDLLNGSILNGHCLDGHRSVVRDCGWHPFDNEIVTASWDGVTAIWRYDERMEKNVNPESWDEQPGDEETSDEFYQPVLQKRYNVKRRNARRNLKDAKLPKY